MTVSCHCSASSNGLQAFLEAAADCKRLLIFTGSGLSATSGICPWDTCGGLNASPEMDPVKTSMGQPGVFRADHAANPVSGKLGL